MTRKAEATHRERPSRWEWPSRWVAALTMSLATANLAACQGSLNGLDLGSDLIDGLTYRVTGLTIAESFPVQIGVTVEIVNGSATPRSVMFPDGCVVLMRAYGEGPDPLWDMNSAVGCTMALVEVDLAPGEREEFQTGLVSAATILGDGLPNGEYRITAYLRPGQVVELDAGRAVLGVP